MRDKETYVRTVPPRPRGLWLVGTLVGLILASMVLYGWSSTLPLVQRANLWPFWKATARSWVSFSMKPGSTRAQFIHEYMRGKVFGGLEPWEFMSWPLLMGGLCVLIPALLGGNYDVRFMRRLGLSWRVQTWRGGRRLINGWTGLASCAEWVGRCETGERSGS